MSISAGRISEPHGDGTSVPDGIGVLGRAWTYLGAIAVLVCADCSMRVVVLLLPLLVLDGYVLVVEGCLSLVFEGSGKQMQRVRMRIDGLLE